MQYRSSVAPNARDLLFIDTNALDMINDRDSDIPWIHVIGALIDSSWVTPVL